MVDNTTCFLAVWVAMCFGIIFGVIAVLPKKDTPRVFWSEDLTKKEVDDLKDQIDNALLDPAFAIVTNYPVTVQA